MSKDGITYRTVKYNDRNKVSSITANNETVTFEYDANNSRYKREDNEQTVYYVGALELTYPKSSELTTNVIKRYVGNDAIQSYTVEVAADESISSHAELKWLFTDYQGSIIAITNEKYEIQQEFTYDAFGKQSVIKPTAVDAAINYDLQTAVLGNIFGNLRGYTGHESLKLGDDNRVIHMNGRIYDADTGRFMQADPFVQAPSNLQNYNRYSYVLNNPMSYTDPSGYLFDKLTKIAGFVSGGFVGAIVAHQMQRFIANSKTLSSLYVAGVSMITGAACGPCSIGFTALATAQNTYYQTGDLGTSLRAGAISGLSAAAFYGVGNGFEGLNTSFGSAGYFGKVAAHGVVGGIMAELQGGKFGHGFAAAGITQAFAPGIDRIQPNVNHSALRIVAAAIVGGTASKVSGGKFANGAITGAFSRMFNDELHPKKELSLADVADPDSGYPFSKNADVALATDMKSATEELRQQSLGKYRVQIGRDGERHVWTELAKQGFEVFADGVVVNINGSKRIYDGAYRDPNGGDWVLIETKTNTSPLIKRQVNFDRVVTTQGFDFVPHGPKGLSTGTPYPVQLFRVTLDRNN